MRPEAEDDFEPWLIGEQALEAAIERMRVLRESTPATEIAATEALWWCAALGDWHRGRVADDRRYYSYRDSSPQGCAVGGLAYVRSPAIHQLLIVPGFVDAGEPVIPFRPVWDEESQTTVQICVQPVEIRWRPLAVVPGSPQGDRHGRDQLYD